MPRKTPVQIACFVDHIDTSMRPRLDAAENIGGERRGDTEDVTSMRPRLDAAENLRLRGARFRRPATSMRPRLDAAENALPRPRQHQPRPLQ